MIVEMEHLIICLQEITDRPPLLFLFCVDDFWRETEASGFFTCVGRGSKFLDTGPAFNVKVVKL